MFFSQETLDQWLAEGRADVEGEILVLKPENRRFQLLTAVHITNEVTGNQDTPGLLGRVKDSEQLAQLGAEHVSTSVILGDNAYEVVQGFVASPVQEILSGDSLAAVTQAITGDAGPAPHDVDLLTQFLLNSK